MYTMQEEIMTPEMENEMPLDMGGEMEAPAGDVDNEKIERVLAVFAALTPEEKAVVFESLVGEMAEMHEELPEEDFMGGPANEEMENFGAMNERLQEF